MPQLTATVGQAAQWVRRTGVPLTDWNPVYRALAGAAAGSPAALPEASGAGLLERQFTASALLVVTVMHAERARRLRIGLARTTATLESADGDQPSQWSEASTRDAARRISILLDETGMGLGAPHLDVRRDSEGLSLTPSQRGAVQSALRRGVLASDALSALPGLDDSLQDALTATGPRLSLSLTLHDPLGVPAQLPVTWSRLWAAGGSGLYRLDRPSSHSPSIHPVGRGDVAGTLHPILEQGLRFAAACQAREDER